MSPCDLETIAEQLPARIEPGRLPRPRLVAIPRKDLGVVELRHGRNRSLCIQPAGHCGAEVVDCLGVPVAIPGPVARFLCLRFGRGGNIHVG